VTNDIDKNGQPAPRRRFSLLRRESPTSAPRTDLIRLVSSGRLVDVYDVLDRPVTGFVAAEDACWQFALADWRQRKPRRWRIAAHRAWREEGTRLDQKRARLVAFAGEIRTVGRVS
jgi:hypothetical protein